MRMLLQVYENECLCDTAPLKCREGRIDEKFDGRCISAVQNENISLHALCQICKQLANRPVSKKT